MSIARVFVAVLIVSLIETSVHAKDESLPWLTVAKNNRSFECDNGKSFVPWGFNYDHDDAGRLIEDYWDKEWTSIEEDFQEMVDMGANVVRVHIQFGRFMNAVDKPNEQALGQLDKLLKLAESKRIYLDLTGLGCYHKKDVPAWYDQLAEKERWDAQARFWEAVAQRCAKSPAIFCYDLMNEPVVSGGKRKEGDWLAGAFGDKHFVQFISLDPKERSRPDVARAWIDQLTRAIRKHDKKHLITVGLVDWSLDRKGLTSGFVPEKVAEPLDFVSVHLYPEKGKTEEALTTLAGFAVGKPILIEETFPLRCGMTEFSDFIDGSRKHASGWVGFYWGKPIVELRKSDDIKSALLRGWLGYFTEQAKKNGSRDFLTAKDDDAIKFGPNDWPWWRGINHDGIAAAKQKPPLKWSDTENVLWKTPLPGRGHGSPTVVGEQIYLATADQEKEIQSVLCFDRKTGKQLWQTEIHKGNFDKKGNAKSSHASSSVACDGNRLFINFLNDGAVYTTALSLEGKQLWQTKICDFVNHQGFGSSPALYESLVIVTADNKGGGAIAGLERATGKIVWKVERPKLPNYASPILLKIGGRDQLVITGCDLVTGMEPLTGKKIWETKGATTECVTSTVTDGERIFTSGGYPTNHVSAIHADGTGKLAWENKTRVYVPSMLAHDGHLYAVLDAGFAVCWKSDTGKEIWRERITGTFSSSLVLVNDTLLATNEAGKTYLFKASPKGFESVGENQLGDEVMATPTICGDRIYHRVAFQNKGKRQEMLYCIGVK